MNLKQIILFKSEVQNMKIQIKSLSSNAISRCNEMYGEKWYVCKCESDAEMCFDVVISENAIIKVHDDSVTIDIGAKKLTINEYEFYKIVIV